MGIFNFFNRGKKEIKKISLDEETLFLLNEGETIIETNDGLKIKQIQFRVVDSVDFELSKALEHLEGIIEEQKFIIS